MQYLNKEIHNKFLLKFVIRLFPLLDVECKIAIYRQYIHTFAVLSDQDDSSVTNKGFFHFDDVDMFELAMYLNFSVHFLKL